MIKTVDPASFSFDQPIMSLVEVHSKGVEKSWLQKSAAVLTKELAEIRPEPGRTFIHLIALGDSERYGANRNGDIFPKVANENYHDTFVKHANFYRHHRNKPHKGHTIYGNVKAAAYNPDMYRVELIIGIDNKKAPDTIEKVASGKDIPVSMACVTDPEFPVLTLEGYKAIKDVSTNDYVWTHAKQWRKVTAINRRKYSGTLYTFTVNGLPRDLELTADHMMYSKLFVGSRTVGAVKSKAKRYFNNPEAFESTPAGWNHVEHMQVGDRFFYNTVGKLPGYGAIDDIALARIMGYYTAEGSFGYNNETPCTVTFTCNFGDPFSRELPALIEEMLPGYTCSIKPHRNSKAALTISVSNTEFAKMLYTYAGRTAKGKYICPELFNATDTIKAAFMGAWLDGDGFVDKKGVHWSSANFNLILQSRDLLASIGIPSSIYKIDHAKCKTSGMANSGVEYTLNVAHFDAGKILEWATKRSKQAVSSRRRPPSMRKCKDGMYAYRIKKVTSREAENIDVYNIEVEEHPSYTLAGLISHNCVVPFDECNICHNKAKTKDDYCECITKYATQVLDDGRQVGMINWQPKFFDISEVSRNADRIAFSLRKVASVSSPILGAVDAAQLGITAPIDLLDPSMQKKAQFLGQLAQLEEDFENIKAGSCLSTPLHLEGKVEDKELRPLFYHLKQANVLLPMDDFFKVILGDKYTSIERELPMAKAAMHGIYRDAAADPEVFLNGLNNYEPLDKPVSTGIKRMIKEAIAKGSLTDDGINRRVASLVLTKSASFVRYNSAQITDAGKYLAQEYAKYKFAFLEDKDPSVVKLGMLQNFVN